MEAAERKINQVLTEQNRYEIPPYQRPYSWETSHVEQLLDDLWSSYESKSAEYFMGSLVVVERVKDARYEVVDGQQRLTTLSMLLARLRDAMEKEPARAELAGRVMMSNALTEEEAAPRVSVREVDRAFFREHVVGRTPVSPELRRSIAQERDAPKMRFIENMEVIDAFVAARDAKTLKGFADHLLSKVSVLLLSTASFSSAYRLFNVLNARGMPLSNADLIKSALFQRLPPRRAGSPELNAEWGRLEAAIGVERFDQFFSHHFTALTAKTPKGALHEAYEPLINAAEGPLAFIKDLVTSARSHLRLQREDHFSGEALRSVRALKRATALDWTPPLLAFLNKPPLDMEEGEFIALLERLTYQFWLRRTHPTHRTAAYAELILALRDGASEEALRAIFRKHADDAALMERLNEDSYGKPYDRAVLLRLEEAMQDASVVKDFGDGVTVEHVLPQTLTDVYWGTRFSSEDHQQWLHKLGNLTLLSGRKNSRAQNVGFDQKREVYRERNAHVSFDMTKAVLNQSDWSPAVIASRQAHFLELGRKLWALGA